VCDRKEYSGVRRQRRGLTSIRFGIGWLTTNRSVSAIRVRKGELVRMKLDWREDRSEMFVTITSLYLPCARFLRGKGRVTERNIALWDWLADDKQ